jgi:hypothetical protein
VLGTVIHFHSVASTINVLQLKFTIVIYDTN